MTVVSSVLLFVGEQRGHGGFEDKRLPCGCRAVSFGAKINQLKLNASEVVLQSATKYNSCVCCKEILHTCQQAIKHAMKGAD